MKKVKVIVVVCFCLFETLTFGQNRNFNCTKDEQEDIWLTKSYESFKFLIEEVGVQVNNKSYWLFGGGEGETSTSNSALIIPMKHETIIYQFSPLVLLDKQIVKEIISIDYLSKYFNKINESVESNVVANAKYFALSADDKGQDECIKVFYSVEFPPEKNNDDFLIDFNEIIKVMNCNTR